MNVQWSTTKGPTTPKKSNIQTKKYPNSLNLTQKKPLKIEVPAIFVPTL